MRTTCPRCGGPAERETDVSDTFFDSSWYFLRYPSADLGDRPFDAARTATWLPVDLYAGGPEHVARHHLYARFVTQALCDLGLVPFDEPFARIRLHGFITRGGAKLAKSKGNIIRPEYYIEHHGADVLRLHLLFCCRWEEGGDWRDEGITGVERFLSRVWRLVHAAGPVSGGSIPECAFTASQRVESAIKSTRFNLGVAALMELVNDLGPQPAAESLGVLVLLLAPFAPYVAEELWAELGLASGSVHLQPWPSRPAGVATLGDEARRSAALAEIAVQVDGKFRAVVEVAVGASAHAIEEAAHGHAVVATRLAGRRVERVIHVDGRAVNFVTSPD